ncbi:MAG TPA: hypothetical protein VLF63_00415 [Patescibacteria group bacterium]|nr:hypothetical protein [Patescibacteria group bacterium]
MTSESTGGGDPLKREEPVEKYFARFSVPLSEIESFASKYDIGERTEMPLAIEAIGAFQAIRTSFDNGSRSKTFLYVGGNPKTTEKHINWRYPESSDVIADLSIDPNNISGIHNVFLETRETLSDRIRKGKTITLIGNLALRGEVSTTSDHLNNAINKGGYKIDNVQLTFEQSKLVYGEGSIIWHTGNTDLGTKLL